MSDTVPQKAADAVAAAKANNAQAEVAVASDGFGMFRVLWQT